MIIMQRSYAGVRDVEMAGLATDRYSKATGRWSSAYSLMISSAVYPV
jgi:hypothetical protein